VQHHKLLATLGLILAVTATTAGQGGGVIRREDPPSPSREIERSAVNFAGPWRPNGASGDTRIIGTVIDIRQVPVANVRVQLRNLDTGNVEQAGDSDEEGEYQFLLEESGNYVVEMVMVDGYVVALSNAGSLARFETLQTVVQLPGRWNQETRSMILPQDFSTFFGMSAESSMTAATVQIAVEQELRPANPGTPVSPQ
jgi:hypothetical protein